MTHLHRRDFLKAAGTAAAVTVTGDLLAGDTKLDQSKLPVCDTHLHLWDQSKFKLPWLSGDAVQSINRSFLMSHYLEASKGHNVTKAVYMEVNVAEDNQVGEAEYVIDLCQRGDNPMKAAVIGGSPQSASFKAYAERFAKSKYIKGVRTVLHDEDRKPGMCLAKQFVDNVKLLGDLGLRFDLCMRPGELLDGAKLVDQCPQTKFVLDHCGNLSVQNKDADLRAKWEKGVKELAARPNVVCKISGIIVTANRETWKPEDLAQNMNFCMDTFGEDRVMFAGDWPVCTLTAPFGSWLNALKTIVKDRSETFQKKLFHDNAVKFYGL